LASKYIRNSVLAPHLLCFSAISTTEGMSKMETVSVKDIKRIVKGETQMPRRIDPVKVNFLDFLVALTVIFTLVTYLMNFYL
jgi:hypothetical protein